MKSIYILLFTALITVSCNSVKRTQKYVAMGDYNQAISLAVKKLQKDKNSEKYEEHIILLEEAYKKATSEDKARIAYLEKTNNPVVAKEIYYRYVDLNNRQALIRPLLPLYSNQLGRNAKFVFSNYSEETIGAKKEYISALYMEANSYMQRNTKQDYRSAYNVLCELEEIQANYRDVRNLKNDARFLGTEFVFVTLNNHSRQMIPYRLEQDLLNFNTYGLDDFWTEYHLRPENGIDYNYGIDYNFQTIDISPERISDRDYNRSERIKDGWEYKRNRNGEIIKDENGNPLKIDKYKKASATIRITTQEKAVFVGGTVVYKDLNRRQQINSFPLSSEFVFKNVFATYRGDEEALTPDDRRIIGNEYIPFPNNAQMVLDAGEDIKLQLKEILEQNHFD